MSFKHYFLTTSTALVILLSLKQNLPKNDASVLLSLEFRPRSDPTYFSILFLLLFIHPEINPN